MVALNHCRRHGIPSCRACRLHDGWVTYREDALAALRSGQNAEIGDANPYNGTSRAFAQLWQDGYKTMLTIRTAATPAMQEYLRGCAGG